MASSRRAWLQGVSLLAGGWLANRLMPAAAAVAAPPAAPAGSGRRPLAERLQVCRPPGDPLAELLRRNRAFAAVWQQAERCGDPQERARLLQQAWPLGCQVRPDALAEGQKPWAAVLACADSRVAPEWIFASGSGELFEVRAAGNTAFAAGIASLEYAVAELAVPLILVLGHSGCGAVAAALADRPLTPLLEELVAPIRAAVPPGTSPQRAVRANALATAAALPRRSALLQAAVEEGRLRIAAAVFDIASGRVVAL
ncbi:MAG: carbonic anhydrase [Cyanobacteriota bacterium]|nr:carbonic anhydrase [Cyanobacteriota bacterium]